MSEQQHAAPHAAPERKQGGPAAPGAPAASHLAPSPVPFVVAGHVPDGATGTRRPDAEPTIRPLGALRRYGGDEPDAPPTAPRPLTIRRSMGLEAETKRQIQTPTGAKVAEGDTKVLSHPHFSLVSDKTSFVNARDKRIQYSNLEFVMKHFDQLAGSEADAIAALRTRLTAMKTLRDRLYAGHGALGTVVPHVTAHGVAAGPGDEYQAKASVHGDTSTFRVAPSPDPAGDDGKVYVHYTVGFRPRDWHTMLTKVTNVSRKDTASTRGVQLSTDAREVAARVLVTTPPAVAFAADVQQEVLGQLALTYMQMRVFIDRTVGLQREDAERVLAKTDKPVKSLRTKIRALERKEATSGLTPDETDRLEKLKKKKTKLDDRREPRERLRDRAAASEPFGKGQPKNKVVALPRASLALAFSMLDPAAQGYLSANVEEILDTFSDHLGEKLGVDLTEGYSLTSDDPAVGSASLGEYVRAGLGSDEQVSQQVLFGGMNEVGVDASDPAAPLLPFEFRSMFKHRVTWDELETDATKVLRWSRDPQGTALPKD